MRGEVVGKKKGGREADLQIYSPDTGSRVMEPSCASMMAPVVSRLGRMLEMLLWAPVAELQRAEARQRRSNCCMVNGSTEPMSLSFRASRL